MVKYYVYVVAVYVPVIVVKEHLYLFYEMPCLVELQYLEIKMIGTVFLRYKEETAFRRFDVAVW